MNLSRALLTGLVCASCAADPAPAVPADPTAAVPQPAAAGAPEVPATHVTELAPGVVSTGSEGGFTFSRNGRILWFVRQRDGGRVILESRRDATWSAPQPVSFSGEFDDRDPTIGGLDSFLVFASARDRERRSQDLWITYRIGGKFFPPQRVDLLSSDRAEGSPHADAQGNLYFARDVAGRDLYFATRTRSGWGPGMPITPVNTPADEFDPCVGPAGAILVFARQSKGGQADLLASLRTEKGFGPAKPLVGGINTPGHECHPLISRDGRTLYFQRDGRIYSVPLHEVLPR